jgi:pyridoxine/pyridoxamine 5'-phosphate oxidase
MELKQFFYDFLNEHQLCVLSSINKQNNSNSALLGFGQTNELEIVFGTDKTSRKYINIINHPEVSVVIGWDNAQTVQYEGTARELDREEIEIVRSSYWLKNPSVEAYDKMPGQTYFIIKPNWMRYTDLKKHPWDIKELRP